MTKRVNEEQMSVGARKSPEDVLLVDIKTPSDCRNRNIQEASDTVRALSK